MPVRLRHSVCATLILSLSAGAVLSAHADTGRYLTWQHKSETQSQDHSETPPPVVTAGGQTYAVPPSPYGQIGDPYARHLNWPTKPGAQAQQHQAAQTAAPQPVQQMASIAPVPVPTRSAPLPEFTPPAQFQQGQPAPQRQPAAASHGSRYVASRPAPTTLEPEDDDTAAGPAPVASISAPVPVARPRPVTVPAGAVAASQAPSHPAQLRPAVKAPSPTASPVQSTPPAQSVTAPVQTASQGYQVPATSKYAARIAAARASAAAQDAQAVAANTAAPADAKTAKADPKAKTKPVAATAPETTPQLAAQETDHVFIPGEQYTNPDEAPRLYSLHRAYGLKPDPITVDHDATGAILDATHLTDGDVQTKDTSSDSEDDADADSTAKTKKADQQ